jgi:uncharacterized protein YlxW (UPF0749 family)
MTQQRCEGYEGFYKDDKSEVITQRNPTDRERYRLMKRTHALNSEAQHQVAELKSEINELKSLVKQLLENNGT